MNRYFLIRLLSSVFCFLFPYASFCSDSSSQESRPNFGLWVPCEGENRTLSSSAKIVGMLKFAQDIGAKEIFLQVYRRNHSWYRSGIAQDGPFQEVWAREKIDPLAFAIEEGHKRGLKIHAWFNVYWIGEDLNVPVVKILGKEIITRDQKRRSLADDPSYGLPEDGFWLDPGDDRVQAYLLGIFKEVLAHYPGVDGIHLDFVRYPFASPFLPGSYYNFNRGIEFGYGSRSVERFRKSHGLDPFAMERTVQNHLIWDQWRRDEITSLIGKLQQVLRQGYPQAKLSCAVLPWPERSYFSSFQDWTRWVKDGQVDFIVTMNYTVDLHLAWFLSSMALGLSPENRVWIGLGPYLFEEDAQRFEVEFEDILDLAPPGIVFFSYESLLKQKGIVATIKMQNLKFKSKNSGRN